MGPASSFPTGGQLGEQARVKILFVGSPNCVPRNGVLTPAFVRLKVSKIIDACLSSFYYYIINNPFPCIKQFINALLVLLYSNYLHIISLLH